MLRFEEFKEIVAEDIKNYLPDYYANAAVIMTDVLKNNDTQLTGLVIKGDNNIAPTIYLDSYFEQYLGGSYIGDIMQDIADVRVQYEVDNNFDLDKITNFEQVKDKILCKLVNAEMNEAYLADKPHTQIEDLAVIYTVGLGDKFGGHLTTTITDNLMERYGITTEELHEIALHNLSESDIEFKSMRDIFIEMMFPDGLAENDPREAMLPPTDEMSMYVLSNGIRTNGASVILDSKTMEDIAEQLGGDFVVIPSSIHEVIIMPITEDMDRETIENMIHEVNSSQVALEERLSDHAYQYDSKEHELVRMDRLEERQNERKSEREGIKPDEKEEKKENRERVSMKEKLPEKKAEVAKKEQGRDKPAPDRKREAALA